MRTFLQKYKILFVSIFFVMCFLSPAYGQIDPTTSGTGTAAEKLVECNLLNGALGTINPLSGECLAQTLSFAADEIGPSAVDLAGGLISDLLKVTFLPLASMLLSVSGFFFELCINLSVVSFAAVAGGNTAIGIGGFIVELWTLIRDILNISLIFVLLYAAIQTIIGNGKDIKKIIAGVILFGVMTNFSLFLVKGAVDVSNIVALEFYQQLRSDKLSTVSFRGGVASTIMSTTGFNSFFLNPVDTNNAEGSEKLSDEYSKSMLYTISIIIILIALSFIFIQAGFMLLARMLVLVAVMVFSPLMFAGGVFTPLKNKIEDWWENFTSQLYLAPAFFIILYVAVFLMGGVKASLEALPLGGPDAGVLVTNISFFVKIVVQTVIIIFGFQQSLNVAKSFSTTASSATTKFLGNAASRGISELGRRTIGKTANRLAQAGGDGILGKTSRFTGNLLKDSTFDMRNIKNTALGKSALGGQILSATKDSALSGDGVRGGFATLQAEEKKKKEEKQKRIDAEQVEALRLRMGRAGLEVPENSEFNNEIRSVDVSGRETRIARPARTATQTQAQADEEWKKTVERTNVQNKTALAVRKAAFLRNENVSSTNTSARAQAAYRAVQSAAREVSAITKKKADLDSYTEELKNFASDSAVGSDGKKFSVDLGIDIAAVSALNKDGVKKQWENLEVQFQSQSRARQTELSAINARMNTPGGLTPAETARRTVLLGETTKLNNYLAKARNAKDKIDTLTKELGE